MFQSFFGAFFYANGYPKENVSRVDGGPAHEQGKNSPLPDRRRNIMKSERIGCKNE